MRRLAAVLAGVAVAVAVAAAAPLVVDRRDPSPETGPVPPPTTGTVPEDTSCPVDAGGDGRALADVIGIGTHLMWDDGADPTVELGRVRDCGFRAIREDLLWEVVEPEPGQYDWTQTDRLLEAAARADLEVLGILGYSAPWSTGGDDDGVRLPPDDPAAFAGYARAVVERYGPSGTFWEALPDVSARPLRAVEIWNEPWGWWSWHPEPDVEAYAELAVPAARAVRDADRDVEILVPGDLLQVRDGGVVAPWLDELLEEAPELVDLVDAWSVHPYPDPRDVAPDVERDDPRWDYGRVALVADELAAQDAAKPVWITEIGWSTSTGDEGVTEEEQAEHLRAAVERALEEWPFVERIYAYTWTRDRDDPDDREANYGLRRHDGSPKPALETLVDLIAEGVAPAR